MHTSAIASAGQMTCLMNGRTRNYAGSDGRPVAADEDSSSRQSGMQSNVITVSGGN